MASPHVAGAIAAIRSVCSDASISQIVAALQKTGKPITDTRLGGTQTKARIQVDAALAELAWHSVDALQRSDRAPVRCGALAAAP
jgi:hypothetical protein